MAEKNIIQSHVLTAAKYDFSIQEKRIIYRIMECAQAKLKGLKLEGLRYTETLFGDADLEMPLAKVFPEGVEPHLSEAKAGFKALQQKTIEVQDGKTWQCFNYIERAKVKEDTTICSFRVAEPIWKAFMDFSKGFDTYRLNIAMSYVSAYSMRWYELLANNTSPITYSIEWIRSTFQLGDKYKTYKDLRKRVIDSAISEINEKSDVYITYTELLDGVGRGRKSVKSLTFTTTRKRSVDEIEEIQKVMRQKNYTVRGLIDHRVVDYLQNTFFFSNKELIANAKHIYAAQQRLTWEGLLDKLSALRADCRNARSPKAYVITSLKNLLNA